MKFKLAIIVAICVLYSEMQVVFPSCFVNPEHYYEKTGKHISFIYKAR